MWRGISLHGELLTILNQGLQYGKVHSIFNRTINIMDDHGRMISLMTKTLDEAPFSILVDIENFKESRIIPGENVYLDKTSIKIGSHVINISSAKIYDLNRGVFKANNTLLTKNIEVLRHIIETKGPKETQIFNLMAFQMVIERTQLLKEACLKEDVKEIIKIGRSLIGLGQGLTPSGDDVLMGLFLVLGLEGSPMQHLHHVLGAIIKEQAEETTDVSYQGLLRASNGFYRSILVRAAEALTTSEHIDEILMEILSIGHSSGRDLLYGVLIGYKILVEKENGNADENNY